MDLLTATHPIERIAVATVEATTTTEQITHVIDREQSVVSPSTTETVVSSTTDDHVPPGTTTQPVRSPLARVEVPPRPRADDVGAACAGEEVPTVGAGVGAVARIRPRDDLDTTEREEEC